MKTTKQKFTTLFVETEKLVKDSDIIYDSLEVIDNYIYSEKCSHPRNQKELSMSITLDGKEYFLYDIFEKIKDVINDTNYRNIERKQKELLDITKKL